MNSERVSRRSFLAVAGSGVVTLTTPAIVHAQYLDQNDIWNKAPKQNLRSAVTLCLDHSGSMKNDELIIQSRGTVEAIRHPNFLYAISEHDTHGNHGVAVCAITFNAYARVLSHNGIYSSLSRGDSLTGISQNNWAILENANDVVQFANFISANTPTYNVEAPTNIVSALDVSQKMHALLPFNVAKRACDISGDGEQNFLLGQTSTLDAESYKNALVDKVENLARDLITVNGFAMTDGQDEIPSLVVGEQRRQVALEEYFTRFLQTPMYRELPELTPGITITVSKGSGFAKAYPVGMTRKLMHEFF